MESATLELLANEDNYSDSDDAIDDAIPVAVYRKRGGLGTRNILLILGFGAVTVGLIMALGFIIADFGEPEPRSQKHYQHAAVAADSVECSIIGRDILKRGGNAADAGVASLVCLNLFSAHSTGIGGGDFILYYDKSVKKFTFFNGREVAPKAATEDMYEEHPENSTKGGRAIAVPGEVSAMWSLHEQYGKLPWADLFAPSIRWAREGFVVPVALGDAIADRMEDILDDANLREIFVKTENCPEGEDGEEVDECLVRDGDIMTRPKLADTLEKIANGGRDAFYNGTLTKDIVADIQEYGGIIIRPDLWGYRTAVKKPLEFKLDSSWTTVSVNPPGSGAVLALILNILEGYGLTSSDISNTDRSVLTYHRMIEAFKFAYAKRSALGDEDFVDVGELVNDMISQSYADDLREKINDDMTYTYEYYDPEFLNVEDQGTTHVSIVDAEGNACSATGTVNLYFGSKVRGSRTGIIFNNEMDDFSNPSADNYFGVPPSPSNFIEPGKRPMSSMTPTIVTDSEGRVRLVVGASGGTRITTAVAATILHTKWLGLNLIKAIEQPRLHDQLLPTNVTYEEEFNKNIISRLEENKGHNMTLSSSPAVVQGISLLDGDWYEAHSDSRKGGWPAGY